MVRTPWLIAALLVLSTQSWADGAGHAGHAVGSAQAVTGSTARAAQPAITSTIAPVAALAQRPGQKPGQPLAGANGKPGEISVVDDAGQRITLAAPARRILSMAPHVTELLYAAGAGPRLVATVEHSDFPAEARRLPQVGSSSRLDMERVVALRPDLIVAWKTGNPARQLEQLRRLGVPVFLSEPEQLADIPSSLERLGRLTGTDALAQRAANVFRGRLAALEKRHAAQRPLRVFVQIYDKPLYTLNGRHILSDALRLCGAVNIFGKQTVKAPQVGVEAVLQADPEVILGGVAFDGGAPPIHSWRQYPALSAVRNDNLITYDADLLVRPGPRVADGTAWLCEKLDRARQRRQ